MGGAVEAARRAGHGEGMMRFGDTVLVTGSSGLLGTALIRAIGHSHNAVGLDRAGPPYPPVEAETISADLTDAASIRRALERVEFAYGRRLAGVVHLAAYYSFSGEESDLYQRLTVEGTRELLRQLRDFEVGVFVLSSTMLVHKPTVPGRPIDEDWPMEGAWDYPKSKIDAERVLREESGGTPTLALRIAGVYDDTGHSIPLTHQIRRIAERRLTSRVFPGDVTHGQAFVHLDDAVEALRLGVERRADLPPHAALLIGEPETLSYDELQRSFARLLHGEEWETRPIPPPVAKVGAWVQDNIPFGEEPFIKPWMIPMADDHYELDIRRARALLGWRPRRSLRDTLPKMIAALRRDPEGWYREHDLGEPERELIERLRSGSR